MDNNQIPDINREDPKEIAEYVVKVLDARKGSDIKMLHVTERTVIADYFVLVNGNSRTQIKALCDEVEYKLGLCGIDKKHTEGDANSGWMLIDFGSVIVHVFSRDARKMYNFEKLYQGSDEVDITNLVTED